jgi:hypothetical protein
MPSTIVAKISSKTTPYTCVAELKKITADANPTEDTDPQRRKPRDEGTIIAIIS